MKTRLLTRVLSHSFSSLIHLINRRGYARETWCERSDCC